MQKRSFNRIVLILILILGAVLRIILFYVSPPNNSFDDHLEVIKIYEMTYKQPSPSQCWECYQPPIYYIISATVLKLSTALNISGLIAWKIVQFINPFLSILVLTFFYKLLHRFEVSEIKMILYMSFIAVLPVDLFTAAMIGNDYLLVFSTVASLFYFLKNVEDIKNKNGVSFLNFICLSFTVVIGALSKQHGLILLAFPTIIISVHFFQKVKFSSFKISLIYICMLILSFSNEFRKYDQTGKFLVSNQDFYDYAEGQYPGSIDKVEFTTFRIHSLFQYPFISNQTSASFPTEIFARTFFDYEWRFLSPKISAAKIIGRLAYIIGILWILYFLGTFISSLSQRNKIKFQINTNKILVYTPIIVGILFFTVPFLQTVRYPYFSSMKSTFALPGIIALIFSHAIYTRKVKLFKSLIISLIFLNISFGLILVYSITLFLPFTIYHLSGPLWPMP